MSQTFEERVEEVLGELHGMAWPLLEESEKRKIVGKVARGIDKGDTNAAWARALGVSESGLRGRLERFRRSEPIDGQRAQDHNTVNRQMRGAKAVLRDEGLLEELLEDPQVFRKLSERFEPAAADDGWETGGEHGPPTPRRVPDVPARSLDLARHHVGDVVVYIQEGRLTPLDRKEIPSRVRRIQAALEVILGAVESGQEIAGDWDAALAEELA
jgi:hypothetical protein